MNSTKSTYRVEGLKMEEYFKKRSIFVTVRFIFTITAVVLLLGFNSYKLQGTEGLWVSLASVPLIAGAFFFGVRRWHDKLRKLADTEFVLTIDGITQSTSGKIERDFKFSEMAVVDKKKFGTTIIKGNWWTRFDHYRPTIPLQPDDLKVIFIPTITTNYPELIDAIKQKRRSARIASENQ
jgi:hypothetical protein